MILAHRLSLDVVRHRHCRELEGVEQAFLHLLPLADVTRQLLHDEVLVMKALEDRVDLLLREIARRLDKLSQCVRLMNGIRIQPCTQVSHVSLRAHEQWEAHQAV